MTRIEFFSALTDSHGDGISLNIESRLAWLKSFSNISLFSLKYCINTIGLTLKQAKFLIIYRKWWTLFLLSRSSRSSVNSSWSLWFWAFSFSVSLAWCSVSATRCRPNFALKTKSHGIKKVIYLPEIFY